MVRFHLIIIDLRYCISRTLGQEDPFVQSKALASSAKLSLEWMIKNLPHGAKIIFITMFRADSHCILSQEGSQLAQLNLPLLIWGSEIPEKLLHALLHASNQL